MERRYCNISLQRKGFASGVWQLPTHISTLCSRQGVRPCATRYGLDPLLQKHRRPQQSGFTRCRSTLDAILALRLWTEIHREFQQPLHVAYVDLKAAFDSVDRTALWKAMRGIGVPTILLDLIIDLRLGKHLSSPVMTTSGVRQPVQGCVLALALFCRAIDFIMAQCLAQDRNTSWHRHPH